MKASEQPMPHDEDLEWQIIGACLADNALIDKAAEIIEPEHFYFGFYARCFEMILTLQGEGEVTSQIMASVMKTDDMFTVYGEQPPPNPFHYFNTIRLGAPSFPNMPMLAKILRDFHGRREIIRLSEDIAADAAKGMLDAPLADIVDKYQGAVDQITSGIAQRRRSSVTAADAGSEMMRRIEEQATSIVQHGVSTGLEWLDKLIGGLFPGKLLVAAARPSMGKTQLATNIARAAARTIPVDYLCGEDGDELAARIGADIDFDRCAAEGLKPLKYGDFVHLTAGGLEFERMVLAIGQMNLLDLNLFDVSGMTLEWIEATCRRRCRQKPGHRLVIIDHLQLVDWAGARRGANRTEIQTEITKRLQALAKELGITFLVLSQLSREVEKRDDKHPRLDDLREGGSIEQDANVVIGIMRPLIYARQKIQAAHNDEQRHKAILEYDDAKDVLKIAVLKNKGGRTTEYSKLFMKPESSAIRDRAPTNDPAQANIDWGKLAEDMAG